MSDKKNDGITKYDRYRLKDVEAYRKKKREWAKTPEQREKRNAYMRAWKEKNKDRTNELARESYKRNMHKHIETNKNRHYLRTYGITLEDKNNMIISQHNKCLICNNDFKNSRLTHLDHDHFTGKVRGLLCSRCNGALGWYEKYKEFINNYLK